ncbi:Werner syndrome ATP-dependent helicase homolog [Pecten maximus]|uniref:Werner syndrome ATP-dependent helicase homolog n=1 Tax=Pecten maximus TaxID=6579 RepID=UPI00145818D2|nr:Werner syndrome ATP-dependent helicase homolog [Pecten maximus]
MATERKFQEALEFTLVQRNIDFQLKDLQLAILKDVVMSKKDVLAVLPTGYGKTIIYSLIPTLVDAYESKTDSIVIVVSPLVALMEDQVVNIEASGIRCVYASKQQTRETDTELKNGTVPILMMSPEALFHGEWRQLFSSETYQTRVAAIVVDEAHCVEQWGDEFRTDYGRLAELRSILPKAGMLALTATASPNSRMLIKKKLCMEQASVIVGNCNRQNITLNCVKAPYDPKAAFLWLVERLRTEKQQYPKTVIYCRSIKSCSLLFKLFTDIMGDLAYCGTKCAKNRLFAMYHHSTSTKCKKIIMDNFPNPDSTCRIVICTSAFGLGVNVPDINMVIHWGASRSIEGFMQEFGRSGRDGGSAMSVLYYHGMDISKTSTDDKMRSYATADTCRRVLLQEHFTPDVSINMQINPQHLCCDNCYRNCKCSNCPDLHTALLSDLEGDNDLCAAASTVVCHVVSESQQKEISVNLHEYRQMLVEENSVPSLLNTDISTGLSVSLIDSITNNVQYIGSIEDLLSEYIFDQRIASSVMDIINQTLGD